MKRSFREKDLFAIDRAFNRPKCRVDDVMEAVSAKRSGIGRRHDQRSRGLQLDGAGGTAVNTEAGVNREERGDDGSH